MNWKIELRCNGIDREYLLKDLQANGLQVIYENGITFLKTDEFSTIDSDHELKQKTIELLHSISPIASFLLIIGRLELPISQLRDDGVIMLYLESGVHYEHNPECNNLVKNDKDVRDVFRLINYDFKLWITWTKIIEIMQKNFKEVKIGGKYYKDVERLNHMANSYKATGVKSRHHLDRIPPPKDLMTEEEGELLMRKIILHWLIEK
jgi:hypothetical protein